MKSLPNNIVLRPRFEIELRKTSENVLSGFEKSRREHFYVKRLDDHIFITFNGDLNHFWTPQLHLEIIETGDCKCKLMGIFGPNPTLWTFFMFLHFGVATLFIILAIWAYSSSRLNRPIGIQLGLMVFTVAIWFLLYTLGRAGKQKGKPQMYELYEFMLDTLKE